MLSIRNYFLIAAILFLIFNLFYSKNFRIDASSDTLILQKDKSFQYFEYYNQIFPSKKFVLKCPNLSNSPEILEIIVRSADTDNFRLNESKG